MDIKGFSPVKLPKHHTKWEYLVLDDLITAMQIGSTVQEVLNSYGRDGWDLVSIVGMSGGSQRGVFKRLL